MSTSPSSLERVPFRPPALSITWAIVGFIFQYVIRRRHFSWWTKYNYVLSAAMDSGVAVSIVVIFFWYIFLHLILRSGYLSLVPGIELRRIIRRCIIRVLYRMKCSILTVGQIACIELRIEPKICEINSI